MNDAIDIAGVVNTKSQLVIASNLESLSLPLNGTRI